jgi:DNA-binding NarL/FixJ family response regulator
LLELDSHNQSGFETLKAIRSGNEFFDVPVIVISPFKDEAKLILTLKMGADMCVRKPFSLPALVARIEAVLRRTKYCLQMNKKTNNVTKNQKIDITSLTEREKDVLLLVAQGESNKSIAQKLVLSEVTVKSHLNSIFKKLNVTNRTQAVLVALESNIVEK